MRTHSEEMIYTDSVYARTVSSGAIRWIAVNASPSDDILWTRDRLDCVGDMFET